MTFEKKIEKLQKKTSKEKRVIAFFATSVVFVLIMFLLYATGAFHIPSFNVSGISKELDNSSGDIQEGVSTTINYAKNRIDDVASTSAEFINMLAELASSTASTSIGVGSTTKDVDLATSSGDVSSDTDEKKTEEKVEIEIN